MEINYKKPKTEPFFQAEIYISKQDDKLVYRVVIGREGTGVPPKQGEFVDYHKNSNLMTRQKIEKWVNEQVGLLELDGKEVEFDQSLSYRVEKALEDLAAISKINERIKNYYRFLWN